MFGVLDDLEVEELLRSERVARLGVRGGDRVYVFPVCYGYDGEFVYVVSHEGLKVQLLRAAPEACIQVDQVQSPAEWRSVMLHGTYEELTDPAAQDVAMAAIVGQTGEPMPSSIVPYLDGPAGVVVYRLHISDRTGRYERSQAIALHRQVDPAYR
jgi:nitroimidazol reductase NimA-like FMN-containing flavoprotein (pyridoxamine 5'-phosphate oxidase superfamily)